MSEWISVKERLPVYDGRYLVTTRGIYTTSVDICDCTNDLKSRVDDETERKRGWYIYNSEWGYVSVDYVTAWQELPEPYKENSNNDI